MWYGTDVVWVALISAGSAVFVAPLPTHMSSLLDLGVIDDEIAEWNRQATAFKKVKDWPSALRMLRLVKKKRGAYYEDTRLALYLQQAGEFEKSMNEFQWLLDRVESQVAGKSAQQSSIVRASSVASLRARIHAKAKLACEREKRFDLAHEHEQLAAECRATVDELKPAIQADRAADKADWEAAREGGRAGMTAALAQIKDRRAR